MYMAGIIMKITATATPKVCAAAPVRGWSTNAAVIPAETATKMPTAMPVPTAAIVHSTSPASMRGNRARPVVSAARNVKDRPRNTAPCAANKGPLISRLISVARTDASDPCGAFSRLNNHNRCRHRVIACGGWTGPARKIRPTWTDRCSASFDPFREA